MVSTKVKVQCYFIYKLILQIVLIPCKKVFWLLKFETLSFGYVGYPIPFLGTALKQAYREMVEYGLASGIRDKVSWVRLMGASS